MSYLALSASFEYICYVSTILKNILIITVRRRQNQKSTDVGFWRLKSMPVL